MKTPDNSGPCTNLPRSHRTACVVSLLATLAACAITPPRHATEASFVRSNEYAGIAAPKPVSMSGEQPRGMAYLKVGLSPDEARLDSDDQGFKVDTDALLFEGAIEAGGTVGGGLRVSNYKTDKHLFGENNGSPDASINSWQGFLHLTIRPASGPFRLPIRVGPELTTHTLEVTGSPDTDWLAIGLCVEVEPEFDLFRDEQGALSIYGRVHGGYCIAGIDDNINSDTYKTDATSLGGEAGLRWQLASFLISGGYMVQQTDYDQSDAEAANIPVMFPDATFQFRAWFLEFGARW